MKTTGYVILDDNKLIESGEWTIDGHKDIEKRLIDFQEQIKNKYKKFKCDCIAFEDIQLQLGNVDTFKKLAYCQAMILDYCGKNKIPYMILAPSHWRKVIKENFGISFGRKRQEQKDIALAFAENHTNTKMSSDSADAYCLALAATIEQNKNKSAF